MLRIQINFIVQNVKKKGWREWVEYIQWMMQNSFQRIIRIYKWNEMCIRDRVKKGQRIMKAFYLEVKEQLENKGMTIYRLSKETGIFEQTLHSMLNGNTSSPKLDNAVKIAKVLEIDLNKLKEGD